MAGDYDGAALAFQKLGSYQNSAERAFEAHCAKAELLLAAGDYDGAVAVFQKLEDYRNSPERIAKARYAKAEALLAAGDLRSAALSFGKAGGYADAKERSFAAWTEVAVRNTISSGNEHAAGLRADGTVVATAKGSGQRDIDDWTDIAAISTIFSNDLLGLKADGTVMVAGWSVYSSSVPESWTDINRPLPKAPQKSDVPQRSGRSIDSA